MIFYGKLLFILTKVFKKVLSSVTFRGYLYGKQLVTYDG